jgi:hypothetical protein
MAAVRSVTLVKWPRRSPWRSVMEKNTSLDSSTDPWGLDGIDLAANGRGGFGCLLGRTGLLACSCHGRPPYVLAFSLHSMIKQV